MLLRHFPKIGSWLCCSAAVTLIVASCTGPAHAAPIRILAAENFYGDLAQQIGDGDISVVSILTNPNQDPHEFEAGAATARQIADAQIVIYNGAGYDAWVPRLLAASPEAGRVVLVAADLVHAKAGANPHVWYDPKTMPAVAWALADALAGLDRAHAAAFRDNLAAFLVQMDPLDARIAALRRKYAGTQVTATEPVFGYMAAALGLLVRNERFQLAVMNDTEPGAAEIAAFEADLRSHAVKALLYNRQTSEALTERMRTIATAAGVPTVGVTETEPPGEHYQQWMLSQLDALDRALSR
jgi:zinc/manganese transport system substrate-binding protein